MSEHFKILEVDDYVTVEELKIAFRRKAKLLHPDVNKSSTAQVDFIQVHQSYEYILKYKFSSSYNDKSGKFFKESKHSDGSIKFDDSKSFKRAERYSKLKYKEYLKSNYYREYKDLEDTASLIEIAFHFSFIFILPIILAFFIGASAIFASIFIAFFTAQFWGPLFRKKLPSLLHVKRGSIIIIKSFTFKILSSLGAFSIVWLSIGFKTFISTFEVIGYSAIIFLIVAKLKYKTLQSMNSKSYIMTLSNVLWIMSFLLAFNYLFKYNESSETYFYIKNYDFSRWGNTRVNSLIELENSEYQFYPSVRFFWDYEDIPKKNKITYTTYDGLLFYKIYTERTFE